MKNARTIELTALAAALLAGGLLFLRAVSLSDAVPVEYRSASPGFGWAWDFDYQSGMAEAGRFGEAPMPWPAVAAGDRMLLPLGQALIHRGLKVTYQGMQARDRFRLDVGITRLDPGATYPQDFSVPEARRGLMIDDRRFILETITPDYLRLRAADK